MKLNAELTLELGTTATKRTSDFNIRSDASVHSARVLMMTYAFGSYGRPDPKHIAFAQRCTTTYSRRREAPRANSRCYYQMRPQAMEAGMAARCEWARASRSETTHHLSQIIETGAHRRPLWPTLQEFRVLGKGGKTSLGDGGHTVKRTPWHRGPRALPNRRFEIMAHGECVTEIEICNNNKSGSCKISWPFRFYRVFPWVVN